MNCISSKRTVQSIFLAGSFLLSQAVSAQVRVPFFADTTNAFINKSVKILKEQFQKSEGIEAIFAPSGSFGGKGILLSSEPGNWPVYAKPLVGKGSEAVLVKTTGNGVVIIGNSGLAVQHGVFIYLEALGFRYYFPHPDWYIVPAKLNLYPAFSYTGQPAFDQRRIWYGYSSAGSKSSNDNYAFWFMANKLGGAMNAVIGHAYDDIVARNLDVFKAHPEWFYPVPARGTIPVNPKFDLANESLVEFVVADALKRLEKAKMSNTPVSMISMSPSDGGGTCNTPACQQLGTITDRVYTLVNRVAREVNKKYPGVWVSGMSYSEYSAPPTKKLEPNTFVSIATAFNYSKYTFDELVGSWSKKAGKVGVYDYLGLYAWDFDLPGKGFASKPVDKITTLIKKYYRLGAKGYDAESTPGSINKGLGHYMVARLLWDVNADTKTMEKEFFTLCFGKAAGLMTSLWSEWGNYPYAVVRESDLASWIDITELAVAAEANPAVRKRLTHIKVYLHYLYLYNNFLNTQSEADRVSLLNYSYNTFDITAFSGYPILWQIGQASGLPGFLVNDANAKYKQVNPSFSQAAFTDRLVAADRKTLQKKEKLKPTALPARFQKAIEPAVFREKNYNFYKGNNFFIGPHYFVFEITKPGPQNYMDLAGGIVTGGGGDQSINVSVTAYKASLENTGKSLAQYVYLNKKPGQVDTQRMNLQKLPRGYYLMKIEDPRKYFKAMFSPAISYSLIATPENRYWGASFYTCFNVPKGTTRFRMFKDSEVNLISPTGRNIDLRNKKTEEADINVQPGEEGIWFISFVKGAFHIEGIPPFLGMDASHMLIPQ